MRKRLWTRFRELGRGWGTVQAKRDKQRTGHTITGDPATSVAGQGSVRGGPCTHALGGAAAATLRAESLGVFGTAVRVQHQPSRPHMGSPARCRAGTRPVSSRWPRPSRADLLCRGILPGVWRASLPGASGEEGRVRRAGGLGREASTACHRARRPGQAGRARPLPWSPGSPGAPRTGRPHAGWPAGRLVALRTAGVRSRAAGCGGTGLRNCRAERPRLAPSAPGTAAPDPGPARGRPAAGPTGNS